MAQITEDEVKAAEEALVRAKNARGNARSGARADAARDAAEECADLRRRFREQEEAAGRRRGFVSGDAVAGEGGN